MDNVCRFCGYRFTSAEEYYTFDPGTGVSPYYCRDGKACIDRDEVAGTVRVSALPLCERCKKRPANTSLTFSYRGEAVTTHYYCEPCCDMEWEAGVKVVDERAAKLKEIGL